MQSAIMEVTIVERKLWKGDLRKQSCETRIMEIDMWNYVLQKQPCGIELEEEDLINEVCRLVSNFRKAIAER